MVVSIDGHFKKINSHYLQKQLSDFHAVYSSLYDFIALCYAPA